MEPNTPIKATVIAVATLPLGIGISMIATRWNSIALGVALIAIGVIFGSGGFLWVLLDWLKARKSVAQKPTVTPVAVTLVNEFDGMKSTWRLDVELIICPAGRSILLVGDKCYAHIVSTPVEEEDGRMPLDMMLLNIHKDGGPLLHSVSIKEDAALLVIGRCNELPWAKPWPQNIIVHVTLMDASGLVCQVAPLLLTMPNVDERRWVGHGSAVPAEIAEFATVEEARRLRPSLQFSKSASESRTADSYLSAVSSQSGAGPSP